MTQSKKAFKKECARKDRIVHLFENLENEETSSRKYEQYFEGVAVVKKVYEKEILLCLENGTEIGKLDTNSDISKVLRVGDFLGLSMGRCGFRWKIIFLSIIASPMNSPNSESFITVRRPTMPKDLQH